MLFKKVSEMEEGIHCLRDSDVHVYKSAYKIFPINHDFEKIKQTLYIRMYRFMASIMLTDKIVKIKVRRVLIHSSKGIA
jgi:hypothetical protein